MTENKSGQQVEMIPCELMLEAARAVAGMDMAAGRTDGEDTPEGGNHEERQFRMLIKHIPEILDPRRIVCLGDYCASHPEWWRVNRIHYFMPDLTHRQIAQMLGLKPHQVRDWLAGPHIGDDCYELLDNLENH